MSRQTHRPIKSNVPLSLLLPFSLVKMVFHIAKKQRGFPNWEELEHAIKRNFGGLLEEDFNPANIFKTYLGFPDKFLQVKLMLKMLLI